MNKNLILTLIALVLSSSCSQEEISEAKKSIDMTFSLSCLKVRSAYDNGEGIFTWSENDCVGIFNDVDCTVVPLEVSGSHSIEVPGSASRVFGLYPYSDQDVDGPSGVRVTVPETYIQQEAGKYDIPSLPMYASASVRNAGSVQMSFSPLAAIFAFNIYRSQESDFDDEKVESITVRFSRSGFTGNGIVDLTQDRPMFTSGDSSLDYATVRLGTPAEIPVTALTSTDEKIQFATQIYLPLARHNYVGLTFEVKTNYNMFEIEADPKIVFAGVDSDMILTSINLTNKFVAVETASFEVPEVVEEKFAAIERIADFSRVGYHYGESPIPNLPVDVIVTPQTVSDNLIVNGGTYADTTSYLQSVIDRVGSGGGGVVLLKDGVYNVGGTLFVDFSNTVLRGESEENTIIKATGKEVRSVISLGKSVMSGEADKIINGRRLTYSDKSMQIPASDSMETGYYTFKVMNPLSVAPKRVRSGEIIEEFVPFGRLHFLVSDASIFKVGDFVEIFRPATLEWIQDIHMDKIADPNGTTVQWSDKVSDFNQSYYRKITKIKGNRIYVDAPMVMALDRKYGPSYIYKCNWQTISESGIENLTIDSEYDQSLVSGPSSYHALMEPVDEEHAWYGIRVSSSEHCWVRNVTTRHMGISAVVVQRALYLTVQNCKSYDPVSYVNGGRRYAFYILGGQMCLFRDCICTHDRHSYVTAGTEGPNVFYNCRSEVTYNDAGPHQNWSTGVLYDNLWTDGWLYVRDRGKSGNGQGWAGANHVFWNCTVANYKGYEGEGRLICQSPWASAKNYAVGCIGKEYSVHEERVYSGGSWEDGSGGSVYDWCRENIPDYDGRPHGEWYPYRQKGLGISGGTKVYLPDPEAAQVNSWWPQLSKAAYSNGYSLYECQLEDRLSRGEYIFNL